MVNWEVEAVESDVVEVESTDSRDTNPHSEINSSNTTGGASKRIGIFLNSYFDYITI